MLPVPDVTATDLFFGNAKHLPPANLIPQYFWDDYKTRAKGRNEFIDFAEDMFYIGTNCDDLKRLLPKEGVCKELALNGIKSVMLAWKPSDEVKIVSAAYMLSEWFTIRRADF